MKVHNIAHETLKSSQKVHKFFMFTKSSLREQKVHKSMNFVHDLATLTLNMTPNMRRPRRQKQWTVAGTGRVDINFRHIFLKVELDI